MRRGAFIAGATAGALGSVAFLRYPARAAEFTLKLGNSMPLDSTLTVSSVAAAKRILEATNGRVEVKVFAASTLGGDPALITQIRSGALELLQVGNNNLVGVLPEAALAAIPFAFTSQADFMKCTNGPLGGYIGAAAAKIGLYKFAQAWYGGAWQMQSNVRPIVTPDDLKGLKMRVPPNPVDVATFKAFGTIATSIPGGEMYVALQTRLVDSVEVPLTSLQTFKLYEVVKYVAITNHNYVSYSMLANGAAWNALPKNLQQIVENEFNAAITQASAQQLQSELTVETTLRSEGLVFNRPDIEPFRLIIRNSGLYTQWRDTFAPQGWAILEKSAGKLIQ